jgi:hypothetical protein
MKHVIITHYTPSPKDFVTQWMGANAPERYVKFNLFLPALIEQVQITCWSIQHNAVFKQETERERVGWRNNICHAVSIQLPPTHFSQNIHVYTRCVRLTFWFVSMVTRRIDDLLSLAGNCAVWQSLSALGVSRSVTLLSNWKAFNTSDGLACTTSTAQSAFDPKVHNVFSSARHWSLSWARLIHSASLKFPSTHTCRPMFTAWPLPFIFRLKFYRHCSRPLIAHLSCFDHCLVTLKRKRTLDNKQTKTWRTVERQTL